MPDYLDTGVMPKSKEELEYSVPADAKTKDELISSMKLKTAKASDKVKLYNVLCMKGHPMMHKFLKDEGSLERIRKAAFIDNGTVKRK
jgi:hypothetical protein